MRLSNLRILQMKTARMTTPLHMLFGQLQTVHITLYSHIIRAKMLLQHWVMITLHPKSLVGILRL